MRASREVTSTHSSVDPPPSNRSRTHTHRRCECTTDCTETVVVVAASHLAAAPSSTAVSLLRCAPPLPMPAASSNAKTPLLEHASLNGDVNATSDGILSSGSLKSVNDADVDSAADLAITVDESAQLVTSGSPNSDDTAQKAVSSPSPKPANEEATESHLEEFLQVTRMDGYAYSHWLEARFWLACICSAGIVWLINLWFFDAVVPYRYRRVDLAEATHVLMVGRVHGSELVPVVELGSDVDADTRKEAQERDVVGSRRRGSFDLLHTGRGRMLVFRHMRYIFNSMTGVFVLQQADAPKKRTDTDAAEQRHQCVSNLQSREIVSRTRTGLTRDQWFDNLVVYGINALVLEVPSIPKLLFQEIFHPFYVFQMYSIILWLNESYYIFAGAIAVIATVSIVQTLLETRRRMTELAALARFDCPVTVLRESGFETISSTQLVPGDVVQVATGLLPCDLALLEGGAVVNESMLTGESVPVVKTNVQYPANRLGDTRIPLGGDSRTTLYSATKVLQLKPLAPGAKVLAMVVRTGFATTKGSLILSILYPKPSEFKFVSQSYKFVAALFALSLVGFGISVWQLMAVQHAALSTIIIRGLDLITIVVPPSLPLALTVGVNFALIWLRDERIFCISPSRISMAGKIRCMAFDKTGTLTEESLVFMGVYPAAEPDSAEKAAFGVFQSPHPSSGATTNVDASSEMVTRRAGDRAVVDTTHSVALSDALKISMACCQSLAVMDGELIGDPLEQQTFEAANATLVDTGDLQGYQQLINVSSAQSSASYGVREQFEFSSALQRMGVLCTDLATGDAWCFVKGSPEMMERLCRPETLPGDYRAILAYFSHQGYRVIAIGRKRLASVPHMDKNDLRNLVECDLTFLGLIVLENKVKPESEPTLEILKQAAVRCVMVSGDHQLTCATVAKECKLVEPGTRIFQSTLVADTNSRDGHRIEWRDTEDETLQLDPLTLRLPQRVLQDSPNGTIRYELAVTGPVFKVLQERHAADPSGSEFHRVILNGQIFARMSPDQKADLVSELQSLGIYTGMCGDGANDCGALKTAHVGVSLSESEASIAAPFTYQRPNISCIPILLSEGRSSLVTSFQLFRYMAMYSMIQFGAVILTYFQGSVLGDWQYLYEDLWLVFPLTILMGSTRANRALSVKRPSGDLLSVKNLMNLFGHMAICVGFQVAIYETILNEHDFVDLPNPNNTAKSYITTALYYFSNCQYSIVAVFFALGKPWKASILTNWKFSLWVVVSFATSAALMLSPIQQPAFFRRDDLSMPWSWKRAIALYVLLFLAVTFVWEMILCPLFVIALRRCRKSGANQGQVFGRPKTIDGPRSKRYHRLRGQFEAAWKAHQA